MIGVHPGPCEDGGTQTPVPDLDDAAALEAADSAGTLRSAASAGAQVRATEAAVAEDIFARLRDVRPRSLVLLCGAGRAGRATSVLLRAVGARAGLPIVPVTGIPPWLGTLDAVLVAGDDAGDPRLVEAVDRALHRGAEVVIAAPDEGPLRSASAGRAMIVPPRVTVMGHNRLLRFLAVAMAVLHAVDPHHSGMLMPPLDALADVLDGEAMRDGPRNEVFHNPAKTLAERMRDHRIVLTGDSPATTALAAHGCEVLLQAAGRVAATTDLAAVAASTGKLVETAGSAADVDPIFHDEQLDGPLALDRVRVFLVSDDPDRMRCARRLAFLDGIDSGAVDGELVRVDLELLEAGPSAELAARGNRPTIGPPASSMAAPPPQISEFGPATTAFDTGTDPAATLTRLAVLALRLEMAAAYLRLLQCPPPAAGRPAQFDGGASL